MLDGKTILITGATDGIGKLTAIGLAEQGASVLIHGRDQERIDAAVLAVLEEGGNAVGYRADLASFDEVRAMADAVLAAHPSLDVLINNAGVGSGAAQTGRQVSRDGHELRFQVNHLSAFLLSHMLVPALRAAGTARIVNVSSIGQHPIDFDDVMLEHAYTGNRAYCQSKLAMIMTTIDMAEQLRGDGITVNALHPGTLLNTKMVREAYPHSYGEPDEGADAVIYIATSPDLEGVTGEYFDQKTRARADDQAYDAEARKRLWTLSAALTGLV